MITNIILFIAGLISTALGIVVWAISENEDKWEKVAFLIIGLIAVSVGVISMIVAF